MIFKKILSLAIITLCLFAVPLSANDSTENKLNDTRAQPGIYASFGLGGNHFGVTLGAGLSYVHNNNIFSLRYLSADEFRFNVDGVYDEPARTMNEIGLLYGRYMFKSNGQLSIAAGLGLFNGIDRGEQIDFHDYQKLDINTLGLAIEGRFLLIFTRYSAAGFAVFGNVNPKKTFIGAMIEIHLGYFPE